MSPLSSSLLPRSFAERLTSLKTKLIPRNILTSLFGWLVDPLTGFFGLSIAFFLPLMLSFSINENIFAIDSEHAVVLQFAFCSSLSVTAPLFVDLALDFLGMRETPYLNHRLLSTLVLASGNGIILSYIGSPQMEMVLITCFLWSYFLEFIIILSSLHTLSELVHTKISTARRLFTQLALFAFFFCSLLSETVECVGSLVEALAIAGFVLFSIMIFVKTFLILRMQYISYQSSEMSIMEWYTSVDEKHIFVQIRLLGFCTQIVMLYLVFFAIGSPTRGSNGLFHADDIIRLVVIRTFFFVFEYFVCSRIFRSQLIRNNQDLAFKTRLIKYFSHEMRSPIMVMTVGLELIEESLKGTSNRRPSIDENLADVRRSCDQSLELLDSLLLYEKIESNSISFSFKSFSPLDGLRGLLREYESAARSVQVGIFLRYDEAQFSSINKRLYLDMMKMKHVLGPLLDSFLKKVNEKSSRELSQSRILSKVQCPDAISFPNLISHCIVKGSAGAICRASDISLGISVDQEVDMLNSISKSRYRMRNWNNEINESQQLSILPTWLHVEMIDKCNDINDVEIATMNSRTLDFTRKGYEREYLFVSKVI